MNLLRRLYLLLLSLALIALVGGALLFPETFQTVIGSISEQSSIIRLLVAVVVLLALLGLAWLQIKPDPRARMTGLMMRSSGAITEVGVDSTRDRILKAVSDVPDVVSVEAQVKPIRGRADIEMDVTVLGHDVKLPGKQKEIDRALNQVINKQLGLRMSGPPRIHIQIYGEEKPVKPVITPPVTAVIEKPAAPYLPPPEPEVKPVVLPIIEKPAPVKPVEPVEIVSTRFEEPILTKVEPIPEPVTATQETPKAEEPFSLNLEKEIADSATEDFVDEELGIKPVSGPDAGDLHHDQTGDDEENPAKIDGFSQN